MTREEVIRLLRQFIHQFDGRDAEDAFVDEVLEFAADMLEQDAQRWISVKDKMPPEKHYGLMPNADFICSDTCLVTADINGIGRVVKQDWTVDGVWRCYGRYITHWMPMPCPFEPSKEENPQ